MHLYRVNGAILVTNFFTLSQMSDTASKKENTSSVWNYHPELPIEPVPYWSWPPRPMAAFKWLHENFLSFTDRVFYIFYALAVALWIMPFSMTEASLSWDWSLLILLRNYIAVFLVVGGLHIWFYGIDGQGNVMRYDNRPIDKRGRQAL